MLKRWNRLLLLIALVTGASIVYAGDGRIIEDTGDVPELVATYGDGIIGSAADWASDTLLAVGGTRGVWLYDITTLDESIPAPELPRRLPEHDGGVTDIRFNADRSRMASVAWGTARVWDMADESLIAEFPGWDAVALSSDGRYLVTGSGHGGLNVWDVSGDLDVPLMTLPISDFGQYVGDIQFSADGKVLAASVIDFGNCVSTGATFIQTWDFEALIENGGGDALVSVSSLDPFSRFALSLDGQLLAYPLIDEYSNEGLFVIDARTRDVKDELLPDSLAVQPLFFNADNQLTLLEMRPIDAQIWHWEAQSQTLESIERSNLSFVLRHVVLSPGGEQVAIPTMGYVNLYQADDLLPRTVYGFYPSILNEEWSGESSIIQFIDTETILQQLRDYQDAKLLSEDGTTRAIQSAGTEYYENGYETIFTFESVSGDVLSSVTVRPIFEVNNPTLSADGSLFAALLDSQLGCGDEGGKLHVWDTQTGKLLVEIYSGSGELAFTSDNRLLAVSEGGRIRLFNPRRGEVIADWRAHFGRIERLAFGSDGELLLTGSNDGTIRAWDVAKVGR